MSIRWHPRLVVGLLVVAAAAVATIAVQSVTDRATAGGLPQCPKRALCAWEISDFLGERVVIRRKGLSNKLAKRMNNDASSLFNNRNKRAYLYNRRNGKGTRFCVSPKESISNLTLVGDFDDKASSSRNTKKKKRPCPGVKD